MKTTILSLLFLISVSGMAAADCDDACQQALDTCQRECPKSVYDLDSGKTLYRTDAETRCQSACRSAESVCRRNCSS